ncbi:MAG: hypothetical protein NTY36_14300 [Deltaproteobacteria bacterium]|nr:hypothetical protein [Deltaproteobacteria bacterium]
MLPTLIFILWAYGMYALISALAGRKGSRLRGRSPWRRYGWLGLLATTGIGLGLAVVLAHSFDQENQSLKLSGFLGTVWADGWPEQMERRVDDPPIKGTPAGDQPVYALLHPGTSPAELAQEKTAPKLRPAHKPKVSKAPAPQAKAVAPKPKKEQLAAKNKAKTAKKKKMPPPQSAKNPTTG